MQEQFSVMSMDERHELGEWPAKMQARGAQNFLLQAEGYRVCAADSIPVLSRFVVPLYGGDKRL